MTALTKCLALLTVLAFAVGCANQPLATERTPVSGLFHPRSSDHAIGLNVAGPVEIDVESFGGDVFVTADPRRSDARVRVVRRAVHGAKRHGEARGSLDEIDYTAEVIPGRMGQRIEVRTMTRHKEPHFQRADVHIDVPEVDGVVVRTRNGRVRLRGVQGEVDVETTNGDVRVVSNLPLTKPITIYNDGGNIDLRVRGESAGMIDAHTVGGRVTHRIRYGRCIVGPGTTYNRINARFNDGDNPIVLRTVNGDIRIASVSEPERFGRFIVE